MDWLTFISNAIGNLAWPAMLITGLVLFREPIKKLILSLKRLRYKDLEMELVEPQETGKQEINAIVSYLQRSPHSFEWFRENTEFNYTDDQFEVLIKKNAGLFEKIKIVSRDESKRRSSSGVPGIRLTQKGRQTLEKALQDT